jgi:hypothetical protein
MANQQAINARKVAAALRKIQLQEPLSRDALRSRLMRRDEKFGRGGICQRLRTSAKAG